MKIKIQILILIILPALPAFSQFSGFPDITPRPPEPATLKPDIRIGNEPSSSRGYSYPGIRHPHHTDTYDYDSEILHRRNLINRKIIEEATAHIKERENWRGNCSITDFRHGQERKELHVFIRHSTNYAECFTIRSP